MADRIPIETAKQIAVKHGYDQVIIVARRIGEDGQEWCTTYGKDRRHCDAAARIGAAIRDNVIPTIERLKAENQRLESEIARLRNASVDR